MPEEALIEIPAVILPPWLENWFKSRGWRPHRHQLEMISSAQLGKSTLLIAPTGGGKTLGGFLASLIDLTENFGADLHTLYVSPLKALAVDVHRNLVDPVGEMGLKITVETRTGDTPASKRQRQRKSPPKKKPSLVKYASKVICPTTGPDANGRFEWK